MCRPRLAATTPTICAYFHVRRYWCLRIGSRATQRLVGKLPRFWTYIVNLLVFSTEVGTFFPLPNCPYTMSCHTFASTCTCISLPLVPCSVTFSIMLWVSVYTSACTFTVACPLKSTRANMETRVACRLNDSCCLTWWIETPSTLFRGTRLCVHVRLSTHGVLQLTIANGPCSEPVS